jgi:RHS repeat-associated protein
MPKVFFPLFFLCALANVFLVGVDPRVAHVMAQLEFLPPWCSPSDFFLKESGGGVFDGYRTEKEMDICGRIVSVTLVKVDDGCVEGRVDAVWESGRTIDRLVCVDGDGVSHLFEYDERDCAVRHVLVGNLSGKSGAREEYETFFCFDESCRPVEIHESNGRVRLLRYPSGADSCVVMVEHGVGTAVRQAVTTDELEFEQIEDDGRSFDIKDVSDVSWRRWKKAHVEDECGELRQTLTIGAYDPKIGRDVVLRKECCLLASNGKILKAEVFDTDGILVSRTLGQQDSFHLEPMTVDDIREFVRRMRGVFPSMVESVQKTFTGNDEAVFARNTARRQRARVVYKDGSEEVYEYALDGGVCQIVYRDGRKVVVKSDCQGRLVSSSEWDVGAASPNVKTYEYQGQFLTSWSMNNGIACRLGRDCHGRVTAIDLVGKEWVVSYAIVYDSLDRIIEVEVSGDETWRYARQYAVNGEEVTTKYVKDGVAIAVREVRKPDGGVLLREEKISPGQSILYAYDDKGRVTRIDRCFNESRSLIIEKQYEMADEGSVFRVTSRFPDMTTQIEERSLSGKLCRRVWKCADGTVALEEKITPLDAKGSTRVQRIAGKEERVLEWKVGDNGHVESIGGVVFRYDSLGRCVCKRSPMGHEVRYEWNAKGQMTRQFSSDETIDYQFTYDDSGRICRVYDAVTCHTVVRAFDAAGRLVADGEKASGVQVVYGSSGALLRLDLPGGESLRYDGGHVYKEGGKRGWSVEVGEKSISKALSCCVSSEMEFHDPLGCWKEKLYYDEFNQLQREEGEFHLTADFDVFGIAKAAENCQRDGDGNVIEFDIGKRGIDLEYDVFGRVIKAKSGDDEECYRYDGFGRLQEIGQSDGQCKRLCWLDGHELGAFQKNSLVELKVPHPVSWQPVAIEVNGAFFRVESDARGSIVALYDSTSNAVCEVYRYSSFGALHVYGGSLSDIKKEAISPWLYCGKRLLKGFLAYDFGARRYSVPLMRWIERDPLGVVDTIDDRIYVRNNPIAFADPTGLFPFFIDWSEIGNSISHAVQCIASSTYKTITFAKQRLDWLFEFRSTYEDVFFNVLGQQWLRCSGYNLDSSFPDVYGGEEIHPKVRITLINGILNGAPEVRRSAALLSSTHCDVPVHFIYAATEGFSGDMLRGAFAKAGLVSQQAKLLTNLWRELIDEMGGVKGGGTLLHYAHSLGATDTLNALRLLEPEERALIRIATFGSPTLLDDGVCAKVDNYVSVRDGVPIFDFYRYADGAKGLRENVHFISSDGVLPFIDHYFCGKTYRGVLEILGQKFQEEFLLQQ